MSDSSDEPALSNVQRTRKRFESFNLHYYAKDAPGATDRSIPRWRQRIPPPATNIVSVTKTSEKNPDTIISLQPVIELPPLFTKSDRIKFPKLILDQNVNVSGGIGRRKNSDPSVLWETPSNFSSTSSSSTSAKISIAKFNESLSKNFKKSTEMLSMCDKNIKSNDKNSVNNNISESDEMQHDKISSDSYKNVKENVVDGDVALSTDTNDDTIIRTKSLKNKSGKIYHILEELITTEEDYIKKLKFCVENYLKYITNDLHLPVPLKGQQHLVFSEIEKILEFHMNIFYPALVDCNYDLDKIIDRIRHYLQQDYFYPYVLYAMNKPNSAQVLIRNEDYFTKRQKEIGDRLGLSSLLLKPIQRLPKYRLLVEAMIQDCMNNFSNKNTTVTIRSLYQILKELNRVLNAANESIMLNNIEIDHYQINIHHQGKFVKSGNFVINDPKLNKKFSGKLFLFTYSLIYTEYSPDNKEKLIYRGYFDCNTLGVRQENNCDKFFVFERLPGHNEIEFECENNLDNWYKILQSSIESSSSLNNTTNANAIIRSQTFHRLRPPRNTTGVSSIISISSNVYDQPRFSNTSTVSSGIGSDRSSECSTTSAHRIPEDEIFDKIVDSEMYYVYYLKTSGEVYLNAIDDDAIKQKLDVFCRNFEQILTYHQNEFNRQFFEFEMSYASLFYLYEMYLNSYNIMEAYKNYAMVAGNACDILKALYKDTDAKSGSTSIDVFVMLPIHRNKYYLSTIDHYIKECIRGDYRDTQLTEQAASLQSKFQKINQQIVKTFKLYSIKQNKIKLHLYGRCAYSDIVSLDIFGTQNHRICIMEHGLICIKFKTVNDIKEEDYREIVFSHPYSINIHLRDSARNPNKLHIDTVDQKSISPSLTFRSPILKTKFSNLIESKLETKTDI